MKQKIVYIITLISFINCIDAKAQEDKIYGGFKIAPNYSIITDKADSWKSDVGYSIGYFEVLELNYKLNLQAEINFSKYSFNIQGYKKSYKSIEIPVAAKYRLTNQLALGIGYQVSLRTKLKDETNPYSDYEDNSSTDVLSKIFSPKQSTSGVFADVSFKNEKIICGLRFLQTNKQLIDNMHSSINTSFYVGIPLF